jgi:hypothetical protein
MTAPDFQTRVNQLQDSQVELRSASLCLSLKMIVNAVRSVFVEV